MPNPHTEKNILDQFLSDPKILDALTKETLRDGIQIALREGGNKGAGEILRLVAEELSSKSWAAESFRERVGLSGNGERLDRFGIVVSPRRVEYVTDGNSPLDMLRSFDDLHRVRWGRGIVSPEAFDLWRQDVRFVSPSPAGVSVRVEVNVPGSTSMNRRCQEESGWNDVPLHELAMGAAACSLVTGSSLLDGLVVRASNGALIQYHDGIHPRTYFSDAADPRVSASRRFALSDPR